MKPPTIEQIDAASLSDHVSHAAKAAGCEYGFGIRECDLSRTTWWAAYIRQSLEEQAHNNRLPDYLRICAAEAKKLGVIVPHEFILYDLVTGEHLERPRMIQLRELIAQRKIAGVIFPALDRLSREPLHQQIFELEAAYYGVRVQYADAPSGDDPGSQFARTILAHAAKLVKIANRKNNRGGNIGRVLSKNVPAGKTPYGYEYRAEYADLGHGHRKLIKAWWQLNKSDSEGNLEKYSEAWVVAQTFHWAGNEGRTLYWIAKELNRLGVKPRHAQAWSPALISFIVKNHCYTGNHAYNRGTYMPNPNKPLGDITGEVRRTIRRYKPSDEWVSFQVPVLVSEQLWNRANENLTERGRGKGKEGKHIDALFRGRIYCPSCGQLMGVCGDSKYRHLTYYFCTTRFQIWKHKRCHVPSLRVKWLDDIGWDVVSAILKQPDIIEAQLKRQEDSSQIAELTKRMQIEQRKIIKAQAKVLRVQEGYEIDPPVYTAQEAEEKIKVHRQMITNADKELQRLRSMAERQRIGKEAAAAARQSLESLRDVNLDTATYAEKRNLIAKLGIKVYPSEDGKSIRIACYAHLSASKVPFSTQIISIASPKL